MTIKSIYIENDLSFDFLYKEASIEDFNFSSSMPLLKKVISTTSNVKSKLEKLFNRYDYIQLLEVNKRKLGKVLDDTNYIDLAEVRVFKPTGMVGNYSSLLSVIEDVQEDLLQIEDRLLTPFLKWTGEVLNKPEKLKRVNVDKYMDFLPIEEYNDKMDNMFSEHSTDDTAKFGELFESNNQFYDIIDRLNKIIEKQNEIPAKKMLQFADKISERAEILIRRCQVHSDSIICSKASRKVIADVLYQIGNELTLYSRISYLIITSQNSLKDSADKLIGTL